MRLTTLLAAVVAMVFVMETGPAHARGMTAYLIPIKKKNDRGRGIINAVGQAERRGAVPWGLTQQGNRYYLLALKGLPKIRYSGSVITTFYLNNRRQLQRKLDKMANSSQLPVGMTKWGRGNDQRAAVLAIKLTGSDRNAVKSLRLVPCSVKRINACMQQKLSYLKKGYVPTAVTRVKNTVWMLMAKAPKWSRAVKAWAIRTSPASYAALGRLVRREARGRLPIGVLFYSRSQAATIVLDMK